MNDSELIFGIMTSFNRHEYSFDDLKYLSEPFQVTETSLRTILSRMSRKSLIESRKEGKSALYRISQKGGKISLNVSNSFRGLDWSQWNGNWWGILFTVPDMENEQRHAIRKKLVAYRFANLYPGFWIRPLHPMEKIEINLESLINNGYCKLIQFDFFQEISVEEISRLWKLDEIKCSLDTIVEKVHKHLTHTSELTPEEGLRYKLLIGDEIVNTLFADPMLPDLYLPKDWKGYVLRALFREFDSKMTEIAKPYVEKIMEN